MESLFQKYLKSDLIQNHLKMGGPNVNGKAIGINSLYFAKSGEPWIGTMGEYHYARANHADWHRELCKMKAGGIEIVSTYVFWNHHEEDEGVFDFSGNNNIRGFLECALEAGLEICLRLGPWRIPAKMLFGKECYLAVSPIENDFYREFDIKT